MNKKVLKRKINFIKDPIQNYILKSNHKRVNSYANFYDTLEIRKNTILYESRDGNSITDNPYAIFKYMLNDTRYKNFIHIWSVQDFDVLEKVLSKYQDHPNVKFVKRNSKEYLKYLASCEYLINNSTFQSFYTPKEGQKYINTWHGTPLKQMGFDIPGNPAHSQNVLRNFLSTDYLLSPNPHTTKMYTDSYKLKGLYEGTIIEEGYPRIDLTLNTNKVELINELQSVGLEIDKNKENILYAPTWKGNSVSKVNNDILQIIADMNDLKEKVGNQYNILVKVHPFLYKQATKNEEIANILVPDYFDTNELLTAVDLLITDYSSIFFDYLVTERPILFYTWDADVYNEERGKYIGEEELPGPILYNSRELINAIQNIELIKNKYQNNYHRMKSLFSPYEDGKVTERIVQYIFQQSGEKVNAITGLNDKKDKIIIYPGGLRDNGITSSFINLMNNIDYERFDVTCFTQTPKDQEVLKNIDLVNKNVRFVFKPGLPVYKVKEVYQDKFVHNRGERGFLGETFYPKHAYEREQRRLFGKSRFDFAIDFSGYSLFWAKYLLATDAKKKICFMHNDLLSDSERKIKGKRPHRINLRGLFSVYHRFDKLVSVSKGTMELNRKNLIEYADSEKFDFVLNTINPNKILQSDNNDVLENQNEENNNLETENYKSNAILKNISTVWNTIPGNFSAETFSLDNHFKDAVVSIVRKAILEDGREFYKFSYNDQMIGWIDSEEVELTNDVIISEKDIDKVAILAITNHHTIWTKPYNSQDCIRVSSSSNYKGIAVSIDKEAETIHGIYYRIAINNIIIGWIDKRALKVLENCTIDETMDTSTRSNVMKERKTVFSRNYEKHKGFIDNIENRTLEETVLSENLYVEISNTEDKSIWTKAYPNYNVKKKDDADKYKGSIAEVNKINKTIDGIYYQFSVPGEVSGWMIEDVFEELQKPVVIKEKEIFKSARIVLPESSLWSQPNGIEGSRIIHDNLSSIYDKLVTVNKEVITTDGTYCHIQLENEDFGWISKEALEFQKQLGVQVDGNFIPYPEKDTLNFVNMGRLSPEKAQDNLIKAFSEFHKQHSNSKLYILGKGPLKDDLKSLINKLDLDECVFLMGQIENPFTFMKRCDCFILSSHYEGQPMVLLEAMTLGMKIVATDIVANRTVLEDGKYGFLVEDSVSGLEEGLSYIAENPDYMPEKFDYIRYNEEAMGTFIKVLDE